ncbi:MAG: hypothetical protein HZB46_01755 [Solirubrobacterales bacterium]|nr:hypothetical protein [Solirubrobacterales bacterium]
MKLLLRTLLAVAALAAAAPAADAGVLVRSAPDCATQSLSRPFTPWLDFAWYTPVAGGAFEAGAPGWTLSSGTKVVDGNEPWRVRGDDHRRSLKIPSGGKATSPTICVGLGHPTLRFFARRVGGTALSTLRVDVRFELSTGTVVTAPVGVIVSGSQWAATLPGAVVANLLPLLPGETTPIQFRFVPQGSAAWQIDDVLVDPWRNR